MEKHQIYNKYFWFTSSKSYWQRKQFGGPLFEKERDDKVEKRYLN